MPPTKPPRTYLGAHGSNTRRLIFIAIALVLLLGLPAIVLAVLMLHAILNSF